MDTESPRAAGTPIAASNETRELRPFEEPHGLLTPEDVAELLHVSPRTVRRLVQRGELAEIRITETIARFTPADVDAFIAVKRQRQGRPQAVPVTFRGAARSRTERDHRGFVDRTKVRA